MSDIFENKVDLGMLVVLWYCTSAFFSNNYLWFIEVQANLFFDPSFGTYVIFLGVLGGAIRLNNDPLDQFLISIFISLIHLLFVLIALIVQYPHDVLGVIIFTSTLGFLSALLFLPMGFLPSSAFNYIIRKRLSKPSDPEGRTRSYYTGRIEDI